MNWQRNMSYLTKKGDLISHKKNPFSTNIPYKLQKVHKSKQINDAFQQQDKGYTEIDELDDVTVRPTEGKPNCLARPLNRLIDIISKPFLIHISSY